MRKGEIISGTSTRGGKVAFTNNYEYLFMNEARHTIGWSREQRDDNCKAVVSTLKSTQEFNHCSGQFHLHLPDAGCTGKGEIFSKIKVVLSMNLIPSK